MDIKRTLFSLILGVFVLVGTIAQDRHDLKGPKRKNYKPWQAGKTEKIITTSDRNDKKGPEAKNHKPWEETADLEDRELVNTTMEEPVKGPKRKNAKAWESPSN